MDGKKSKLRYSNDSSRVISKKFKESQLDFEGMNANHKYQH